MNLSRIWIFSLLAIVTVPVSGQGSELILNEVKAVSRATRLGGAVDAMSFKVKQCIAEKLAAAQLCFCRYPGELRALQTVYDAAIVDFPEWKDRAVTWTDPGSSSTRTLLLPSIRKQLAARCPA